MAYVNLGQIIYPVGAIFASTSSTSPSSMFGGTWSQITGDACLMAGTTIGNIGSKTISEAQMPKHSHVISQGDAEKPTATGHRNVGKAWYQTLGQGNFTTKDGDFLYTSAGVKCQWITENAGTRLTGGGNNICLTPTDAICGGEQLNSSDASCVISKTSKSELVQVLKQFVRSQLEQYTNLLVQQAQPASMVEDGHLSQMVDSLDCKGLGIISAEKMNTNSLSQKCQGIIISLIQNGFWDQLLHKLVIDILCAMEEEINHLLFHWKIQVEMLRTTICLRTKLVTHGVEPPNI